MSVVFHFFQSLCREISILKLFIYVFLVVHILWVVFLFWWPGTFLLCLIIFPWSPFFGFPTWRSCFCCVGFSEGKFSGFITRVDFPWSLKYFWEIKLWLRHRKWLKLLMGSPPLFYLVFSTQFLQIWSSVLFISFS